MYLSNVEIIVLIFSILAIAECISELMIEITDKTLT